MAKVYDPKTKTWKSTTGGSKKTGSSGGSSGSSSNSKKSSGGSNKGSTNKKTAKGKTTKKQKTIDYNVLQGEVDVVPTATNLKITPRETVKITGVGKYLSMNYYVAAVTRVLDANGFSLRLTLTRENFRDTIKPKSASKASSSSAKTKKHTVQTGDTLLKLAKKYYGAKKGSKWTKIRDKNKLSKSKYKKTTKLPKGKKLIIP